MASARGPHGARYARAIEPAPPICHNSAQRVCGGTAGSADVAEW